MEQLRQDAVARYRGLLVQLVDIAVSETDDTATAASAVLEAMCRTLGASDGSVALLDAAAATLITASTFGTHSSLMGDIPPVLLTSDYESARVFRRGAPHYTGQHYPDGREVADAEGTARWRSSIGVQASAVLPLTLGGRLIGVLSLRWSSPQDFDETMRELLEALASLAALAIEHARCSTPSAAPSSALPTKLGGEPELMARFEVTSDGVLVPRVLDAAWSGREDARAEIRELADSHNEIAYDVFMLADGRLAALIMRLSAGGGQPSAASEALGTLRTTARILSDTLGGPHDVIGRLNASMATLAPTGAAVDAWLGTLDLNTSALEWCSAGDAETLVHLADDRLVHKPRSGPPIGSSPNAKYGADVILLMPGDQLAVSMQGYAELRLERPARRAE